MNIPTEVLMLLLSGVAALQGWTLHTVVALRVHVAALEQSLKDLPCRDRSKPCLDA